MVKPVKKKEQQITIASVVATHLELVAPRPTAPQCLKQLLSVVQKETGNSTLNIRTLKQGLRNWAEEGWVEISGDSMQLTRAGRHPIKMLAEDATAAPVLQ